MTSAVAVIDPVCLSPYEFAYLDEETGTEAAILRLAGALSNDCRFQFYQAGRTDVTRDAGGLYRPLDMLKVEDLTSVSNVIVVSSWKTALKVSKLGPGCPVFLWMHSPPGRHNRRMGDALAAAGIEIVCASESLAKHVHAFLADANDKLPAISSIPDPVADELKPDTTPRDIDRLFFPGAPHKGLSEALVKFAALRRTRPTLRLEVAEHDNLVWPENTVPDGVHFLGKLSDKARIEIMRSSLCVFHPQSRFAETSGLTLAEANAVGTPVLAHAGLGSNDEILLTPGQCVDTNDLSAVGARIDDWRRDFPAIATAPGHRLSEVAAAWKRKLTPQIVAEPTRTATSGATPERAALPNGPSR
ncbi:glycosyltransferase [Martelella endophytica]|uniref:Glycosyl transferase family 1 domain-containing protein n=1 Tax=Martelella endophytica TaxID=1486262 RepID=A0A0D5LNV3_MAREN|nr:glycosyltransferase [Martelella endophytica]AJY45630.1 hypothetical protein TM49_07995 [Martelella endophytica]